MEGNEQKHFVLVHGACHGAWCWYKLQPLLEAAGHRVTVFDLSASGIDPKKLDELRTFPDYTLPLFKIMESIPPDEKVVLVGHSLGGINLAFAMEKYPEKISVAIFVVALMPDTVHRPSYVLEEYFAITPTENFLDTQFAPFGRPEDHLQSILFGPKYISSRLYYLSPREDVALANSLVRPASFFMKDLSSRRPFSNERFGSVKRAFIIAGKDLTITQEFQRWQINNTGVAIVKEINTDHMYFERTSMENLLDTQFIEFGGQEDNLTAILFGPEYISSKMYQLCSPKDMALANTLLRPTSLFMEDMTKRNAFFNEGFGSIKRAFVICAADKGTMEEFQRWHIENNGVAMIPGAYLSCSYILEEYQKRLEG